MLGPIALLPEAGTGGNRHEDRGQLEPYFCKYQF